MRRGQKFAPAFSVKAVGGNPFGLQQREGLRMDIGGGAVAGAAGGKSRVAPAAQKRFGEKAAGGVSGGKKQNHFRAGVHDFFILGFGKKRITCSLRFKQARVAAQSRRNRIRVRVAQKTHID
jgi:hypothetical protein